MIFVMCFSGITPRSEKENQTVEDLVYNHLQFWKAHKQPLVFVSAEDKPFRSGHTDVILPGNGYGECVGRQFQKILEMIVEEDSREHSYIYEYDSICLDVNKLKPSAGLWGNVRMSGPPHVAAHRFAMAPWAIDRKSAKKLLEYSREYFYIGCWDNDRVITTWAVNAGVPVISWHPYGFSTNTLSTDDQREIQVSRPFPLYIHGIKSKDTLNRIISWYYDSIRN